MVKGTPRLRALALLALSALLALGIAACGSSSSSSGSTASTASTATSEGAGSGEPASAGVEAAEKIVKEHRLETSKFTPPGPPIDASSLSGKSIWYIPISASIPALTPNAKGIEEAAKAVGLNFNTCDGKFQPAAMSACLMQAVNSNPVGIITNGVDPKAVGPAMSAAAQAGVPIMGLSTNGQESATLRFLGNGDGPSQAIAMNWIIADSEGKANILAATVTGTVQTEESAAEGTKVLEENCPECEYEAIQVDPTASTLASATSSALLKNPEADYGFPQFDFQAQLFERGAQQAGRTSSMKMVSMNAQLSQLQEIAQGGFQAADAGANANYIGWETMDGLLRMILGKPAANDPTFPVRVFDETNIKGLELTEAAVNSGELWGPPTYQQEFPQLWGVG